MVLGYLNVGIDNHIQLLVMTVAAKTLKVIAFSLFHCLYNKILTFVIFSVTTSQIFYNAELFTTVTSFIVSATDS
jgi:hypothetical protein